MIGNKVSNTTIHPSCKLWWSKYHYKVTLQGNRLVHDAMVMRDMDDFHLNVVFKEWDSIKNVWNRNLTYYFKSADVCKQFINKFEEHIIKAEGVRTQEELDVINDDTKILRRRLFFNKYRYVIHEVMPDKQRVEKYKKLLGSMNARFFDDSTNWRYYIYLAHKKDVAKLQLTLGKIDNVQKVVLLEEI